MEVPLPLGVWLNVASQACGVDPDLSDWHRVNLQVAPVPFFPLQSRVHVSRRASSPTGVHCEFTGGYLGLETQSGRNLFRFFVTHAGTRYYVAEAATLRMTSRGVLQE